MRRQGWPLGELIVFRLGHGKTAVVSQHVLEGADEAHARSPGLGQVRELATEALLLLPVSVLSVRSIAGVVEPVLDRPVAGVHRQKLARQRPRPGQIQR